MNVLIIGRGYPEVETGLIGIFEYEQAEAIAKFYKKIFQVNYMFCDNRSILRLKKFNKFKINDGIATIGRYFPIGGLPTKLFNKIKTILTVKMLKETIKNTGVPDIIHIHFPIITLTNEIWEYLLKLNSKLVITEHYSRVQNKELTVDQIDLLKNITRKADKFLCVNSDLTMSIQEITGIEREFIVVPNVVSSKFSIKLDETIKYNYNYNFVSIGRLVEEKKFDLVIKAFAKKFASMPDIKLIIVGDGEKYIELKNIISSFNMETQIEMTGFLTREDTANLLKESDAYVTGSSFETFGVPIIEAMSSGKPVIVANNSPLRQYIQEDRGTLFNKDDILDLANMMKKVFENRNKYDSVRIAEFANDNFSDRAIADQLHAIYRDCINK